MLSLHNMPHLHSPTSMDGSIRLGNAKLTRLLSPQGPPATPLDDPPPLPMQPVPADPAIDPQTAKSPSSASDASHQPAPALPIPQYQTFGPDPSLFDDPTIYHIRDVSPGMTDEEKANIYGVTQYPFDDLHDLTPGTPPDRDFSNAKPPNQATATTFANYLESYVRPMAEEDLAFLRERVRRASLWLSSLWLMCWSTGRSHSTICDSSTRSQRIQGDLGGRGQFILPGQHTEPGKPWSR